MVPAKDFETSRRFYVDLGFQPRTLTDRLVEIHLGAYAFILHGYYVQQWADNFVTHMRVTDVSLWWDHIAALDLPSRYGVKSPGAQKQEDWGLVVNVIDPSGVLWRIAESSDPIKSVAVGP
jgi:catechol 2,3-dioxygenase-like lactoylglutathione lyase family enzyme